MFRFLQLLLLHFFLLARRSETFRISRKHLLNNSFSIMRFFLGIAALLRSASALEPMALLATQPAWQAGQPVAVHVKYDGERLAQFFSVRSVS